MTTEMSDKVAEALQEAVMDALVAGMGDDCEAGNAADASEDALGEVIAADNPTIDREDAHLDAAALIEGQVAELWSDFFALVQNGTDRVEAATTVMARN